MSRNALVGHVDELAPGQRKLVFVEGRCVVILNVEGTIRAFDDSCPHNGASLANGKLSGHTLRCPAHGLEFDLLTGCMPRAGGLCLKTFPVIATGSELMLMLDE